MSRASALEPALAEAAIRAGADAIGLVVLEPAVAVHPSFAPRGARPVPSRPPPEVVRRVAVRDLDALPAVVREVPAEATPVVLTTWALSRLSPARREAFARRVEEAGAARTVAWLSFEGVGVAPTVPTLGDRPASGHSIVGLALSGAPTEAIGRCWARGRWLEWLAA